MISKDNPAASHHLPPARPAGFEECQLELSIENEAGLHQLASIMAPLLQRGDCIALSGALASGKTSFARAVIRMLAGDPTYDVPSPSFALIQLYEFDDLGLAHLDLYRLLSGQEFEQLGIEELLPQLVTLIEWPERASAHLPSSRLTMELSGDLAEDKRIVTLNCLKAGEKLWRERLICVADEWEKYSVS